MKLFSDYLKTGRPALGMSHLVGALAALMAAFMVAHAEDADCGEVDPAEASGSFRGQSFRLREGRATVMAPDGRFRSLADDYSEDVDRNATVPCPWNLETHQEWTFRVGKRMGFLLLATPRADVSNGSGGHSPESTLLLFWRDDDSETDDWNSAYVGNRLCPLTGKGAVVLDGNRLAIDTAERPLENGNPVVYLLEFDHDRKWFTELYDDVAARLYDGQFFYCAQKRDALQGSLYAGPLFDKLPSSQYYAMWRHPLAWDEYRTFVQKTHPSSVDDFIPVPALDGELPEFFLPKKIGNALAAIYADRASFEIENDRDDEKALADAWGGEKTPPLLTIREVAEYSVDDASIKQECVDFSFSRDGSHLVVEEGYRIPEVKTPDGLAHHRSRETTIFAIPETRQEEVRTLLAAAASQPDDWEELYKTPEGGEALGFLVIDSVTPGVRIDGTGVKVGDILLSYGGNVRGVDFAKRTLRESCQEFIANWRNSDTDDISWIARIDDGQPAIFSCDTGFFYECEVACGTIALRVRPRRFTPDAMERIGTAFSMHRAAHPEEGLRLEQASEP